MKSIFSWVCLTLVLFMASSIAGQRGYYNQGPYNQGPYSQGPYNQGPYNQGPYNQGYYGAPIPYQGQGPRYYGGPRHVVTDATQDEQDLAIDLTGSSVDQSDEDVDPWNGNVIRQNRNKGNVNFDVDDNRRNRLHHSDVNNDPFNPYSRNIDRDRGSRQRQKGAVEYGNDNYDASLGFGRDHDIRATGHQASDISGDDQRYDNVDDQETRGGFGGQQSRTKSYRDASRNRNRNRNLLNSDARDQSYDWGRDTDKYNRYSKSGQDQGDDQRSTDHYDDEAGNGFNGVYSNARRNQASSRNRKNNRGFDNVDDIDRQRNFGQDYQVAARRSQGVQNQGDDEDYARDQGDQYDQSFGQPPRSRKYDNVDSNSRQENQKGFSNTDDDDTSENYGENQSVKSKGNKANQDQGSQKKLTYKFDSAKDGFIDPSTLVPQIISKLKSDTANSQPDVTVYGEDDDK